jgi:hypothetical protein
MPWFKGEQFSEYRLLHETCGYAVVGRGRYIPVDSHTEGVQVIAELLMASSTALQKS